MRAAALAVAIHLLLAGVAVAAPEDIANDISDEVMSPYCPGVTLHDCPSQAAIDLREEIESWAADGMSKSAIMDRLVDEYGESILARPPTEGAGVLAWALPAVLVIAGLAIAWLLLRRVTPKAPQEPPPVQMSSDERRRLDVELKTLRERG